VDLRRECIGWGMRSRELKFWSVTARNQVEEKTRKINVLQIVEGRIY